MQIEPAQLYADELRQNHESHDLVSIGMAARRIPAFTATKEAISHGKGLRDNAS